MKGMYSKKFAIFLFSSELMPKISLDFGKCLKGKNQGRISQGIFNEKEANTEEYISFVKRCTSTLFFLFFKNK